MSSLHPLYSLPTIPLLGVYRGAYEFATILNILKLESIPENINPRILAKIKEAFRRFPSGEKPDFFHITLGLENLFPKISESKIGCESARVNIVPHPYIFRDNTNKTLKAKINVCISLFTESGELLSLSENNESNKITINSDDCELICNELAREIIVHPDNKGVPSFSPNNCSFLLNLNSQISNFYLVLTELKNQKLVKVFVGEYVVITHEDNGLIFGDLVNGFKSSKKSYDSISINSKFSLNYYKDAFLGITMYHAEEVLKKAKTIDEMKEILIKGFSCIFILMEDNNEIDKQNIGKFYYELLLKFIENLHENCEEVENFAEKELFCSIKSKFFRVYICLFMDFHLNHIKNVLNSYDFYLNLSKERIKQIAKEVEEKHKKDLWPNSLSLLLSYMNVKENEYKENVRQFLKGDRYMANPNISLFQDMCEKILNGEEISDDFFSKFDSHILSLFYSKIWILKGKFQGIHKKFGEMSFRKKEISPVYWVEDEEKIDSIQNFIADLEKIKVEK